MEVLIIGGIAAGASVAAKAKRTNPEANVTIIEKEDYVSFGACGLPYYIGEKFTDSNQMFARSVEKTKESGINLLLKHEVVAVDFDNKVLKIKNLEKNEQLEKRYDKLAICTGATPIIIGEGADSENVFTVTKLYEVEKLKQYLDKSEEIVIIGSGFIGLEVADQIVELGKKVKIIQKESYPMNKVFDKEFSELITMALEEKGVEFMVEHSYERFETENGIATKVITDKGEFECDMAIIAIGFRPNTAFLKDTEIEMLQNGAIISDKYGKTNIEDVYALGDCASVYNPQMDNFYSPLATYANKMGRLVGENIVSEEQKPFIGAFGSGSLMVGDYGVAITGISEETAKSLNLNYSSSYVIAKNHTSYYPGQSDIHVKLVYDKDTRKILGGQIFGKSGAVERLSALSVAVYKGLTVDELGFVDFAYSPPYAPTWDVLNIAGNASK
ncbi:CoA-disulfide reductase [Helcococcus kunzii]|uniref:CoA-disulfide reductase n=1 Tax=Helcococcus kunzii TaxID=40091 RepID=UPI001C97292C|nr:CoA-disulfide reductase [Helcococcus kunzii]QZO75691.1 CoA-disulfide reductase [Helcococcus kunzii]